MPKEDFDEEFRPSIPQGEIRPKNATGDERQSPVVTALMLTGCVVALVFFGDEVKQYTIGPRGASGLINLHTALIVMALMFGVLLLVQIFEMKDN